MDSLKTQNIFISLSRIRSLDFQGYGLLEKEGNLKSYRNIKGSREKGQNNYE